MAHKTAAILVTSAASLLLAACGSEEAGSIPIEQPVSPQQNEAPATAVSLPTTPLDRDAVFGLVSDTVIETAPCPFLSDETAIATAETNYDLIRREVSNEECRWSKNAGFSVVVSVDAAADTTPLKDRAYNMDSPPVVKEQPGPGEAAVILYDTTWETERPYAMGFELNDDLITIFVTGMKTDPARLTATASEVASKLPTAPSIGKQIRQIAPAQDFCAVWSDESIGSLAATTVEEGLHSSAYGTAGCKWSAGYGYAAKSVTLARYKQGDTNLDKMIDMGGTAVSGLGDRAVLLKREATDDYAGDSTIWVEIENHQFTLTLSGTISDHAEVADTLMRNLFSRI